VGVAKKFENLKIVQISGVLRAVSSDADGMIWALLDADGTQKHGGHSAWHRCAGQCEESEGGANSIQRGLASESSGLVVEHAQRMGVAA
jgi:hypothetical protein